MKKGDHLYQQYVNILKEELRPAMGCTEPIALAYAAANEVVVVLEASGSWYKVLFNLQEGYMHSKG